MLQQLPAEIQIQITLPLGSEDLANVRLCCHSLNKAARIRYYESIRLELSHSSSATYLLRILDNAVTNLFARNPALPPLIKHVSLDGFSVFQRLRTIEHERKRTVPRAQLLDPVLKQVYHESKVAALQTAIARFLAQLSNLQSLHAKPALIFTPFWSLPIEPFTALRSLTYLSPKLLEHGSVPLPLTPSLLTALSLLPTLSSLTLAGRDYAPPPPSWPPSTTPQLRALQTLHLQNVHIRESTLALILATTPSLHSLSLLLAMHADPDPSESRSPFLDAPALRSALTSLPSPLLLSYLALQVDWWTTSDVDVRFGGGWEAGRVVSGTDDNNTNNANNANNDTVDWGIRGALGSLSFLRNLRCLRVAPPVLFGWGGVPLLDDVVPAGVEEVVFGEDMCNWDWGGHAYRWAVTGPDDEEGIGRGFGRAVGRWLDGGQPLGLRRVVFLCGSGSGDGGGGGRAVTPEKQAECDRAAQEIREMRVGSGREVDVLVVVAGGYPGLD
ncbi:hypothetical protein EJ05DRAFT_503516 [Pseudovirgaria hyperparasitica]|uniref:F-box domain-containing protein n=1 Tax=Pseudovirgaria hyperparasitica TaxID=470096 RepID=A0A6A6VZV4_9PEZI|nr:uncharacterized protein EJ05DRAFT_503516 [Pseudovirgaria hyperparasitica]KAF2755210.1 hypothetical protein EJ05DRAFT_503516 [Pseudovirgaria hyperparasitica]